MGYNAGVTVNGPLVGTVPTFSVDGVGAVVSLTNAATTTTGQFVVSAGTVGISGPLTNQGSFTVTGGSVTLANALTTQSLVATGGTTTLNGASTSQSVTVAGGVITLDSMTHQILTTPGASVVVGGTLTTPSLDVSGATALGLLLTDSRITPAILHATAGVFTVNGTAMVPAVNLVGVLAGTGTLAATGSLSWTRGWMEGSGTTTIGAQATLMVEDAMTTEPHDKYLVGRTLDNQGTITWTGTGALRLSGGATVSNAVNALVDVQSNVSMLVDSGPASFVNGGLFTKSAGGGTAATFISVPFTNTGTVRVQAGRLDMSAVLNNSVLPGGTYLVQSKLTFSGAVNWMNGATLVVDGPSAQVAPSFAGNTASGVLNIRDNATYTPAMDFDNQGLATVEDTSTFTLSQTTWNNGGVFRWTASKNLLFAFGAAFVNQVGGLFDAQQDATVVNGNGGGSFTNAGTVRKSGGNGTSTIGVPFDNAGGIFDIQSGTFNLGGGGAWSGASTAAAGIVNLTGGTFTASDGWTMAGAGLIRVNGGTLTLSGNVSAQSLELTAGTLNGTGTLLPVSAWEWSGGSVNGTLTNEGTLTITGTSQHNFSGGTFTNTRTVVWAGTGSGNLLFAFGAAFVNQVGGLFDAQQDATVVNGNGGGSFTNAGTVRKSGGNGTSTIGVAFSNTGTLDVRSGAISLTSTVAQVSGNILTGGTWYVGANSTLSLSGTITTNQGNVTLDGIGSQFAALNNLASNAGSFTVGNGRNFTTVGNFTNNGTLGVGSGSTFTVHGSLTNFVGGTLTGGTYLIAGTLVFNDAAIATNAATIVLGGSEAAAIVDQSNNDALANFANNTAAGSFTVQNGFNFTTPGDFNNDGALAVGSGSSFTVTGSLTQTGSLNVLAGGTLTLQGGGTSSGPLNNDGAVTIGAGSLFSEGGAYTETGTLEVQAGAELDLLGGGTGSGGLSDDGTLVIGAGSSFTENGSYAQTGTLAVQDTATLVLAGTFANFDGAPLSGGTYDILGTFQFAGAAVVTNAATLILDGPDAQLLDTQGNDALANSFAANAGSLTLQNGYPLLTVPSDFSNTGTLIVGPGSTFDTPGVYSQTAGLTTLNGGTLEADGLLDLEGGVLNGAGTLQGTVLNNAEIDVGQPGSPGVLMVTGDYSGSGTLVIEIGGTNPGSDFDQLTIGGQATFASGTLTVNLINGFQPNPSNPDSFQVMTFGAHDPADDFAVYNGLNLGNGLSLTPTYDSGSLTLVATSSGGAPTVSGQGTRRGHPVAADAVAPTAVQIGSDQAVRDRLFAGLGEAYRVWSIGSAHGHPAMRDRPDLAAVSHVDRTPDDAALARATQSQ